MALFWMDVDILDFPKCCKNYFSRNTQEIETIEILCIFTRGYLKGDSTLSIVLRPIFPGGIVDIASGLMEAVGLKLSLCVTNLTSINFKRYNNQPADI